MRILVISNLYPPHYIGGYELRCQVVVKALRERGHDVHVLTSDHRVEGVEDHSPSTIDHPPAQRSLRVHGFFGHPWLPITQLRALEVHNNATVRDAVETLRPDVVHVWNLGGISKSIIHTLEQLQVPVAYDISDHWIARSLKADVWLDWWNRSTGNLAQRLLRSAYNLFGLRAKWSALAPTTPLNAMPFRKIYFCSDALRQITIAKGYNVQHGEVIHCPVDTVAFHGEPTPADKPLRKLLYVGRLAEDKGTLTALRAFALVQGHFHGTLHIYGKGDEAYTARCHDYVRDHALPVTFHHATPDEMPRVYREHDALLFTSEWEEPFALTPLEAMASGIPVIGTTTGGSAELLRDGLNSLTYPAGDAQRLANNILKLATSGSLRHALAVTGKADVIQRCSQPIIIDQIEAFLGCTVMEASRETARRSDNETVRWSPHSSVPTSVSLSTTKCISPSLPTEGLIV